MNYYDARERLRLASANACKAIFAGAGATEILYKGCNPTDEQKHNMIELHDACTKDFQEAEKIRHAAAHHEIDPPNGNEMKLVALENEAWTTGAACFHARMYLAHLLDVFTECDAAHRMLDAALDSAKYDE